jgi:hypothetical protein
MKKLTHFLAAAVAVASGVAVYPGVGQAVFAFAHDHSQASAVTLGAAVIAALYHNPKKQGGG